jgi:hypothetical protein
MAFTEQRYQDGVSQLSVFLSCTLAELSTALEKLGAPLPAIRPDLQRLAERIGLVSQSLLRIYFRTKEIGVASNLYYGPFGSHFRQIMRIINFTHPFEDLPLYVTNKGGGGCGCGKQHLKPLFLTAHLPIYQDPWDDNTCSGLHKCVSVMEKIIAGVLASLNATLQDLRESPQNIFE